MTKYEKRRQTIFQSLRPNELSKAGYEPITNYEERIWTFETTKVGYEPITNYEERIWTPVWCLTFEPFPTLSGFWPVPNTKYNLIWTNIEQVLAFWYTEGIELS